MKKNEINEIDLTIDTIKDNLSTSHLPDPDLIIRTSGEQRLSNFLLWESSYSELYFIDKLWPEITYYDILKSLHYYTKIKRRYGK